jgi:flagellin
MSEITLSKAVRSNLLNLQGTAELLSKAQERLATGLRVNSALDNPTNFFTASGLNSRASDLSQLMDAISNAVQTVAAADKGITAITKLVESAQATARQALQTAATVPATPLSLATSATSNTTSTVITAVSSADAGVVNAGAFTTLDVSGITSPATAAEITGSAHSATVDISGGTDSIAFTLTVDGNNTNVLIDSAAVTDYNTNASGGPYTLSDGALTDDDVAAIINYQVGANVASVDSGAIQFTSPTQGTGSNLTIASYTATTTAGVTGIADTATVTGAAAQTADSITFSLAIDGDPTPDTITISAAAVATYNALPAPDINAASLSVDDVVALINSQASSPVASNVSGQIRFTSPTTGTSSSIAITGFTATSVTAGSTGIADNSDTGAAAQTGTAGTITINGQNIVLNTGDDAADILTAFTNAATTSTGTNAFTVSNVSGVLTLTGTAGNDLVIGGTAGTLAALGLSAGTVDGQPAVAAGPNPKRADLVDTYNDLLLQITAITRDAGFNGVNLLNGDNLSVLFNEDGSSSLDIAGVSNSALGLGLAALGTSAFDTNASINLTLDDLKGALDTLRTQASQLGSNLSIIETRQDFTKNMINVLETGAANLTLADTNEEAANVLALQTRQQLSSTALSLSSQADQNVLRLFQ